MKATKTVIFLFTFFALISCKKYSTPCINKALLAVFVGFSPNELDTIVVRKFTKGDNLTHVLDSSIFLRSNDSSSYYSFGDTTFNYLQKIYTSCLMPENDWQIFLPSIKMTTSITRIQSPQTSQEYTAVPFDQSDNDCFNPIKSFIQDGKIVYPSYYGYLDNHFVNTYAVIIKK